MHEMGIANSILEAVYKELHRYPGQRADKVGVRIGEYAGVDTESLRFCFEALVKASELEPLALDIDWRENSEELDLAYLELDYEPGSPGTEGTERKRSDCYAAA